MTNEAVEETLPSPPKVWTWLFNPFHYVAGGKALGIGLAVILLTGLLCVPSNSHVDGVLDFHSGRATPLLFTLTEGLIDWLLLSLFLFPAGMLLSKSRFRMLDVFGTQALARAPMLLVSMLALLPDLQSVIAYLVAQSTPGAEAVARPGTAAFAVFAMFTLLSLPMLVWMIVLMYRAFAVSFNVRGGKAIGAFAATLILAEIASKIILFLWMSCCFQLYERAMQHGWT